MDRMGVIGGYPTSKRCYSVLHSRRGTDEIAAFVVFENAKLRIISHMHGSLYRMHTADTR